LAPRSKKPPSPPEHALVTPLPMQLLRARDAVMQRFRPRLHALGLTDQQGRILRVLTEFDNVEMLELSALTSINPASLSRMIPRMDRQGIVKRRKHRDDARRVTVSLTDRGRALIEPMVAESDRIYALLTEQVGAARMRELRRSLDLLIQLGGSDPWPRPWRSQR
jgi:homoprotocatechuate degradation regulator HpaR